MNKYMKSVVSALKHWVTSQKSDWNQNDPTAANFVKNRPFYEDIGVLFDQRMEIANEETVIEGALPISDGDLVKVTWNGVEYECTAYGEQSGSSNVYFGNTAFMGEEDNGVPFVMVTGTFEGEAIFVIIAPDFVGQSVSIKVEGVVIKTLDPKFLPDGIGGGVVIATVSNTPPSSGTSTAGAAPQYASISLADIVKAVGEGKQVYFMYNGVLMHLEDNCGFEELVSGVMVADSVAEPYAIFCATTEAGLLKWVKIYNDSAIEYGETMLNTPTVIVDIVSDGSTGWVSNYTWMEVNKFFLSGRYIVARYQEQFFQLFEHVNSGSFIFYQYIPGRLSKLTLNTTSTVTIEQVST